MDKKICIMCGKEYVKSKNINFCGYNCFILNENIKNIDNTKSDSLSNLHNKIIELKRIGLTHTQISIKVGCSKSTVSYHCSSSSKNKSNEKSLKFKNDDSSVYRFSKMLNNFKSRSIGDGCIYSKDWNKKIRMSVTKFKDRNMNNRFERNTKYKYTYHDAIEHLGGYETKCYLTGEKINIIKDRYCLDHIIPSSKGGDNSLSNMGITTPKANSSKSDMSVDEYIELCKKVLVNFGYTITK